MSTQEIELLLIPLALIFLWASYRVTMMMPLWLRVVAGGGFVLAFWVIEQGWLR
jgi:hypothetical protein